MDVIVFLCVSLGSRCTCTGSEAGFSSQNATLLGGGGTTKEQCFVRFLQAKGLSAKDIHKEMFPVYGWKCLLQSSSSQLSRGM
jgi:hypothetical protein